MVGASWEDSSGATVTVDDMENDSDETFESSAALFRAAHS